MENMGHARVDPPQQSSSLKLKVYNYFSNWRSKRIRQLGNQLVILALTFMVSLHWQFRLVSGSVSGTVAGYEDFDLLPASNFRSLENGEENLSPSSPPPPQPAIVLQKPKISLSVVQFEHGAVVSTKTILQFTESNVTKILDEEDGLPGGNDVEGDDNDNHGIRPGGGERTGIIVDKKATHRVLRMECMSNFPVEFNYEGCGVSCDNCFVSLLTCASCKGLKK